jgi:hypothetical protein
VSQKLPTLILLLTFSPIYLSHFSFLQ